MKSYYVATAETDNHANLTIRSYFVKAKNDADLLDRMSEENAGIVVFFKELK